LGAPPRPGARLADVASLCAAHYRVLAFLVLVLAAGNLTLRLDREFLTDWDESLYTTSAWEMTQSGQWAATTFHGALDYYNSKPPLNVWLIALSFKAFGVGLVSARLPSVVCAWLTVLALMWWARRTFGALVSLCAGVVLATSFGFLHVHAGRSANADAPFALTIVLMAITLSFAASRPRRLSLLGPLAAVAFLLKGFGVLLPLTMVALVLAVTWHRGQLRWSPLALAAAGFVLPVSAWVVARWQVDGAEFFRQMIANDAIGVTTTALEGHPGGPLYYLDALQKHEVNWLLAAIVAGALVLSWRELRMRIAFWRAPQLASVVVGAFIVASVAVPTAMQTKLPWYLNPFYPVFALVVGWLVARALEAPSAARRRWCAAVFVLMALVAEARIGYYSFTYRDLDHHQQGLLLREASALRGHHVHAAAWAPADQFVLEALAGGRAVTSREPLAISWSDAADDYLMSSQAAEQQDLKSLGCRGAVCLYGIVPALADADSTAESTTLGKSTPFRSDNSVE
jgi:4-amino-4-deoxy-L-arabinose transferase-like glycosyltransferase